MGPKAQGWRGPDREVYWYGVQRGLVAWKERQLRVSQAAAARENDRAPTSRARVEVSAYTALQADQGLADRMLELGMNDMSTCRL